MTGQPEAAVAPVPATSSLPPAARLPSRSNGASACASSNGPMALMRRLSSSVCLPQLAEALARMQHAGVVDQQVAGVRRRPAPAAVRAPVRRAIFRSATSSGSTCRRPGMLAGQRVQRGRLAGMAAGGDDVVAARQQLADERQPDAAVGAGDEDVCGCGPCGELRRRQCAFRPSVSAAMRCRAMHRRVCRPGAVPTGVAHVRASSAARRWRLRSPLALTARRLAPRAARGRQAAAGRRRHPLRAVHPAQRPARDRAHRPQGADRRGQRLVPRRQQGRAGRPHRLRAPVRAPDVQRLGEPRRASSSTPFELVGATDQNGTTNSDRTNYFENVPTTALDIALWMESDRMGHLLGAIDQKTLDEQRGVVQNEKRQGENQPYGQVWDVLGTAMYPDGPSVPPQHDRLDERPQRGLAGRRQDLVPHLVRPQQRGAGAGRRHRRRHREGEGGEVLRRHPGRPDHGPAEGRRGQRTQPTRAPK